MPLSSSINCRRPFGFALGKLRHGPSSRWPKTSNRLMKNVPGRCHSERSRAPDATGRSEESRPENKALTRFPSLCSGQALVVPPCGPPRNDVPGDFFITLLNTSAKGNAFEAADASFGPVPAQRSTPFPQCLQEPATGYRRRTVHPKGT